MKERRSDTPPPGSTAAPLRLLIAAERALSVLLLGLLVGLMAAQVGARYVFGSPIAWSEELARFVLIWLGFIGAVFVMAEGGHITVDVVSRTLSRKGRLAIECVSSLVVITACAMLLPAGIAFARQMGSVRSPALQMPMSWWYWAAGAGFGLLALHTALNLIVALRRGAPIWDASEGRDGGRVGSGGTS